MRNHVLLALAVSLALACSKGETLGCGSGSKSATTSDGAEAETKEAEEGSALLGIYKVDRYQQSQSGCDQLIDAPQPPGFLVLYNFRPGDGTASSRLGGAFCGDVSGCRLVAERAPEPAIGYSFVGGDDASGWQGWAVTGTGAVADKCGAAVQSHVLTAPTPKTIQIATKTVDVIFEPITEEDGVATCSNKHAIAVANKDLPCKSMLVLKATREADL